MTEECAKFIIEKGFKMVGLDTQIPDKYPFPIHKIFFTPDAQILENLMDISRLLDIKKFNIIALPLKTPTDAAPVRVIAKAFFDSFSFLPNAHTPQALPRRNGKSFKAPIARSDLIRAYRGNPTTLL